MFEQIQQLRDRNANIQSTDIQQLPLAKTSGTTHLLESQEQFEKAWKAFHQDCSDVIGFDTESRPSFKKGQNFPVCLLQLSTENQTLLLRLNKMRLPQEVKDLLEDPNTLKVGLAIHDDIKGLKELDSVKPDGFLDLASMARKLNFKKLGLRNLTATLLEKRLSKGAKLSNWEARKLSPSQVEYASLDAQISRELYFALKKLEEGN